MGKVLLFEEIATHSSRFYWIECNGEIEIVRKLHLPTALESILEERLCLKDHIGL